MSDGWSFDGSIMTFAFPMLLFIAVAVALYVLYTKPADVPGHRKSAAERPVSYTPIPGVPTATEVPGAVPAPGVPDGSAAGAPGTAAPVPASPADATMTADSASAAPEARE